jgi:uncharacterized protein
VLTLVAIGDRQVRIEVGAGYGNRLNSAMQTVIDDYMVPRFKQNDYSGGIRNGTDALIQRINHPNSPSLPSLGWLIGGSATGLGATALGLRQYQRYRHRRCPQCSTLMVRLDEVADDRFLNQAQRMEEKLGSVDYDVWQCPQCQAHDLNRYGNWFSRYHTCRSCRYQTLSYCRDTLVSPTYDHSGTARITESCKNCSYHRSYTETIPRLERSSSSSSGSSSSFGGGHSLWWGSQWQLVIRENPAPFGNHTVFYNRDRAQ